MTSGTLVLSGADVRALLPPADCISAVEAAFRRQAEGGMPDPVVLGMHLARGGFHVKAAALRLEHPYFVAKLNANFPGNPQQGLPTIQGIVALCDADDGRLLALLDSIEITRLRTGAATAIAAKYLARPESTTVMLFGCGSQSRAQLECLAAVLPLSRLYACDPVPAAVLGLTTWARDGLGLEAVAVEGGEVAGYARQSDVIVTCTPSRRFFLTPDLVASGSFVAGVGVDAAEKRELDPALLAGNTVVTDVLAQCAAIGDLHHAIEAGAMRPGDVHAELAELVIGTKPGRTRPGEITVFDSTGTALEDVAAAALAYERALARGLGTVIRLAG